MSMSPFPAVYSLLRPDALIARVLAHYVLMPPLTCALLSCGLTQHSWADLYHVTAGTNHYVLHVCVSLTPAEEVVSQAEVVGALARAGLPMPAPIARRDGSYVTVLDAVEGPRVAWLEHYLPGEVPDELTEAQTEEYGELVARIHAALDALPPDGQARWAAALGVYDLATLLDESLSRLLPVFDAASPVLARSLELLVADVRSRLVALDLPHEAPAWGIVHGDLHKRNILIAPASPLAIIDWETLGMGWRVYDLAALRRSYSALGGWEGSPARADALFAAFLDSYTLAHPLSPSELEALPLFVAARHLWIRADGARLAQARGLGVANFDSAWCEALLADLHAWLVLSCE